MNSNISLIEQTEDEAKQVNGGFWGNVAGAAAGVIGGAFGAIIGGGHNVSGSTILKGTIAGAITGAFNPIRGFSNLTTAIVSNSGALASGGRAVGGGAAGGGRTAVYEIVIEKAN